MNNAHIFYLELAKAVIKAANYDKSVTLWVMGVAFGPKDVPEALSEVREYFFVTQCYYDWEQPGQEAFNCGMDILKQWVAQNSI